MLDELARLVEHAEGGLVAGRAARAAALEATHRAAVAEVVAAEGHDRLAEAVPADEAGEGQLALVGYLVLSVLVHLHFRLHGIAVLVLHVAQHFSQLVFLFPLLFFPFSVESYLINIALIILLDFSSYFSICHPLL